MDSSSVAWPSGMGAIIGAEAGKKQRMKLLVCATWEMLSPREYARLKMVSTWGKRFTSAWVNVKLNTLLASAAHCVGWIRPVDPARENTEFSEILLARRNAAPQLATPMVPQAHVAQ